METRVITAWERRLQVERIDNNKGKDSPGKKRREENRAMVLLYANFGVVDALSQTKYGGLPPTSSENRIIRFSTNTTVETDSGP